MRGSLWQENIHFVPIIPTLNVPNSVSSELQILHKNATYLFLSHPSCSAFPISILIFPQY